MLSYSMDESYCWGGLSDPNSSGVTGGVSASQGAVGMAKFLWHDTSTGEGVKGRQVSKNVFDGGGCIGCMHRL